MNRFPPEFDQGDRPHLELLRSSLDDAEDQLRRARSRLDRAQRRVRNLEVAVQSWKVLVAQFEHEPDSVADRGRTNVRL